jgi:hypothetical protein
VTDSVPPAAPRKFRKRPVVIEAMRYDGSNGAEVADWCGGYLDAEYDRDDAPQWVLIDTLEGQMRANEGDWVIRGVKGEFYPCKPDIFEATYEPV